jgi:hypothetical protein
MLVKVKKSALAASAGRSTAGLRSCAATAERRRSLCGARGASGSVRRMSSEAITGNTTSAPSAQRQPAAAVSSPTPRAPRWPPATSAAA